LIYDSINQILLKNNILAPKLLSENYSKNYIEIEDFGDQTIFNLLKKSRTNKLVILKRIIRLLNKLQLIRQRNIKNFKKKNYKIQKYKPEILIKEASLFCDWYIKRKVPLEKKDIFTRKFKKIVKKLTLSLKLKNNVFVHRDFHVSNMMLINNKIGLLDSQDALIGNRAYDLASLIDDVRLKTSSSFKKKIFNFYLNKQKKLNKLNFKNDFEILSILRNLKIIGIFTRLAVRDNKKKYLKLIPYAWQLISLRINENRALKDLKNLLIKNFKKKLNEN
jgi:aminoglycoside/choline kinase family phosphotransferase